MTSKKPQPPPPKPPDVSTCCQYWIITISGIKLCSKCYRPTVVFRPTSPPPPKVDRR